jgi:NADPH2:quinone reductase
MKAIRVHEYGGIDQLMAEDIARPDIKADEVRIKVEYVGVNFTDIYHRKGIYPSDLPFTVGEEFAGTVDETGKDVKDFRPGDRVATAFGQGAYAEYATAPAARLARVPGSISLEGAAAVFLQGMTAHYLATSTYPLKPGDTALVHAAAGGVGQLLVQVAKRCGAQVIATVSTQEKAEIARRAGADQVILYSLQDFEAETMRLSGGKGVDVVYDGVGKTTFLKGLNCLKPRGMMVLYGQASGPVDPIDPQLLNRKGSLFLTRPTLRHYALTSEELRNRINDLFRWMDAGQLRVSIDKTFPLLEAPAAHTYLEKGQTKGKILLTP